MKSTILILITGLQIFLWACFNKNEPKTNKQGNPNFDRDEYYETEEMVFIKSGSFNAKVDQSSKKVFINSFMIDKYEVSIAEFEEFIIKTGYVPQSDRENSAAIVLKGRKQQSVKGVNWRHDENGIERRDKNYPVVFVSYEDAEAYAKWAGKRLPTLYEWLYVAISGMDEVTRWRYILNDSWHTNNTSSLKNRGLKAPNTFGIFDIIGNAAEHVLFDMESLNNLPPGLNLDDATRAAFSSFFNDPEDLLMPSFSIGHKKGVNFYTGFRCAKDL